LLFLDRDGRREASYRRAMQGRYYRGNSAGANRRQLKRQYMSNPQIRRRQVSGIKIPKEKGGKARERRRNKEKNSEDLTWGILGTDTSTELNGVMG